MLDKTTQDWRALASGLEIEGRAFMNGRYQHRAPGCRRGAGRNDGDQ